MIEMPPTSRLARAPTALFAMVMGLGGLAVSWRKAHAVFGTPAAIGEALMLAAALVYAVLLALHALRFVRYPGAHLAEFRTPASASFTPAFTVATVLMAAGVAPYAPEVARPIWLFAAALHLIFAFLLLRRWFSMRMEPSEASPAWFIPVVGNILMPVIGKPLGFGIESWFLFSVGLIFWLILAPVMTYRLFFVEPMPERAAPSLFILLAPPAVGGLAMLALAGGEATIFSHVMFGFALFISGLLVSLLGKVFATQFAVGWWALTFPTAAFATLSLAYADLVASPWTFIIAIYALTLASLNVAAVAILTVRAVTRGELVPRA